MNAASAVAAILKEEGVEYLFLYPDIPIIDPAAAVGIRPIMARTERAAVAMADGYSRVSNGRQIGVVAVQYGPGIENSFGAIAQAFSDSAPILVICGGEGRRRIDQAPNFDPMVSLREVTKWAARVNSPDRVPELMRRAFTYLRTGRRGPILLELPMDVAFAELDDEPVHAYKRIKGTRTAADSADVAAAADTLVAAQCPLIHAGQGVLYAEASSELVELAELLQTPVMTSLPGKSAFPENHPLSLGAGGLTGPSAVAHYLERADVILAIGASLTVSAFAAPIPPNKSVIQATVDERDLNKDYEAEHILMGDAQLVLRQLIDELMRRNFVRSKAGVASEIAAIKQEALNEWLPYLTSDEVPISPYRVIWELQQELDLEQTIITHDSGRPRDQLAPFWTSILPRSYIGWGKSSHLGYGNGMAMGGKLAAPEKIVISFMGDAAIGFVGMEIETAVRLKIPIMIVLLDNGAMSNYEQRYPIAFERYDFKRMLGNYAQVAEGLGAHAERIESPSELAPAISRARQVLDEGRPVLLDVITKEETRLSKFW